MSKPSAIGPYLRLAGISYTQLPPPSSPDLQTFIHAILNEAIPFIDGAAPKSGRAVTWTSSKGAPKTYASSKAPVYSSSLAVRGSATDDAHTETWFCRRSCHQNAQEKGTASWAEFEHAFQQHHHETEAAFGETVMGAREALAWECADVEVEVLGGRWSQHRMGVVEMKHRIEPKPLRDRVFPVLQLASALVGADEFVVVSIPARDFAEAPQALLAKEKGLVVAAYAAVERIRVLPETGEIEWIMATASDAGGVLPQWMQNLAVPGMLTKDVDMFLSWIPGQRTGGGEAVA